MHQSLEGATDAANMLLFWPDLLPEDGDGRLHSDPIGLIEELRAENKLIWFLCEGDGSYRLSIYLNEEIPDHLRGVERAEEYTFTLRSQGIAFFGGMECVFKKDGQFLKKHPGMGTSVSIPDGSYEATVLCLLPSEDDRRDWIIAQASSAALRSWDTHKGAVVLCVAGFIATLIAVCVSRWQTWSVFAGVEAFLIAIAFAMTRMPRYRLAKKANDEYAVAFPAYVLKLKTLETALAT